jgi:predicted component of type VI protein secretion system
MNARLVVVGGDAQPAEIHLRLPVVVGRGRQADLVVPHPFVSRVHCEIFRNEGKLSVRDLGSLNGTYVNQTRVSEQSLQPGDLLSLGSITFRVLYELEAGRAASDTKDPSDSLPDQPLDSGDPQDHMAITLPQPTGADDEEEPDTSSEIGQDQPAAANTGRPLEADG